MKIKSVGYLHEIPGFENKPLARLFTEDQIRETVEAWAKKWEIAGKVQRDLLTQLGIPCP